MAPTLILNSNNAANGNLFVDVSQYLDLTPDGDMDTYDPGWSSKVIGHSLLKEGGTFALEDRQAKELTFPVKFNATSRTAVQQLVAQVNQILSTAGATYSWQDTGTSQPTIFDSIVGEFQVKYKYREQEKFWVSGDLKLNVQPFGRTAGPRPYAAASGIGPLLMISPFTGSATVGVAASTQAGVAGFGGRPGGASTGVFYWGSPSLAGDAPARLQVSYAAPLAPGATNAGVLPAAAVSLLPDANYQPLVPTTQVLAENASLIANAAVPASQYLRLAGNESDFWSFSFGAGGVTTQAWGGAHRVFALARASSTPGTLGLVSNGLVGYAGSTAVGVGDWGVYDLGTFTLRGSQAPQQPVTVAAVAGASSNAAVDLAGFVVLPDRSTWFMSPTLLTASQYGSVNGPGAGGNESFIGFARSPVDVTVDSAHVYWCNDDNNAIGRANIDGTSPSQTWITGASPAAGVAVDSSHVYWTNAFTNTIGRANIDGTSPSQTWITGANNPIGVAVDSSHVYWTNQAGNTIGRANLNGTSPSQSWITGASAPFSIDVDATHAYWTTIIGAGAIARANLDGSAPSQTWLAVSTPFRLTVDSAHIYWTNQAANTIGKANIDGSNPNPTFVTGANFPDGVAVDSRYLYWANLLGNTIGRTFVGAAPITTQAAFSNVLLLDDIAGDQFIYTSVANGFTPSPTGLIAASTRITPYTRGLVPEPDPNNGLPIVAILGVGQNTTPSQGGAFPQAGASWTNSQSLATYAQVNVLERVRYVMP